METITRSYPTANGLVEGIQVKWGGGGQLIFAASSKGMLVCGFFDLAAIEAFGGAAAMVESTPENPIGNLDRFPARKITQVNARAAALGLTVGMDVADALAIIA